MCGRWPSTRGVAGRLPRTDSPDGYRKLDARSHRPREGGTADGPAFLMEAVSGGMWCERARSANLRAPPGHLLAARSAWLFASGWTTGFIAATSGRSKQAQRKAGLLGLRYLAMLDG